MTASPTTINANPSTYEFTYFQSSTSTTIQASSTVQITFPSDYKVINTTSLSVTVPSSSSNKYPGTSGVASVLGNVITITGLFPKSVSGAGSFILDITGIQNPSSTKTTGGFTIAIGSLSTSGMTMTFTSGTGITHILYSMICIIE